MPILAFVHHDLAHVKIRNILVAIRQNAAAGTEVRRNFCTELYFVSYYIIYFIIRCPMEACESLMESLNQGASNGGLGYSRRGQARPVGPSARFGVSMHLDPS